MPRSRPRSYILLSDNPEDAAYFSVTYLDRGHPMTTDVAQGHKRFPALRNGCGVDTADARPAGRIF